MYASARGKLGERRLTSRDLMVVIVNMCFWIFLGLVLSFDLVTNTSSMWVRLRVLNHRRKQTQQHYPIIIFSCSLQKIWSWKDDETKTISKQNYSCWYFAFSLLKSPLCRICFSFSVHLFLWEQLKESPTGSISRLMTSKKELKCTTVRCVFPRRQTGFLFFFTVHTSFVLSKNMRGKQHFNPKESQRPRAANAPQFMQKEQSHWTQSCFMSVSFASVGASQIGV